MNFVKSKHLENRFRDGIWKNTCFIKKNNSANLYPLTHINYTIPGPHTGAILVRGSKTNNMIKQCLSSIKSSVSKDSVFASPLKYIS